MIVEIVQGLLYFCLLIFTIFAVIHIHYERSNFELNVDIPEAYKLRTEDVFPVRSFRSMSNKRSLTGNRLTESRSDAIFGRSYSSTPDAMPSMNPIVLSQTEDLQKFNLNAIGKTAKIRCPHHCNCRECSNLLCVVDCDQCQL